MTYAIHGLDACPWPMIHDLVIHIFAIPIKCSTFEWDDDENVNFVGSDEMN